MKKQNYNLIFVVLTYRNINDLKDFINTTKMRLKDSYKIIVVNSYYDDDSLTEFRDIAINNDCDFLNVENRGYGYGNNNGIEFAKDKYDFNYLIVSNPDVEIIELPLKELEGLTDCIIAPSINTLTGKSQNPFYYSNNELIEFLKYYSCIKKKKIFAYIGIIINKLNRELRLTIDGILKVKQRRIYATHGSFVIIGTKALESLGSIYNEEMFLFHEENHLAKLAESKGIKTIMVPSLKVLHKEDGSVGLEGEKMSKYGRESFIIYYESWKTKNKPNKLEM